MLDSVAQTHLVVARSAFADGEYQLAYTEASACVNRMPALLEARALRVNAALQLQRWQDAIPDLQTLLQASPNNLPFRRLLALCWLRIGNTCGDAGDHKGAIAAYETSMQVHPEGQDARYNLAVLLLRTHHYAQAAELIYKVLEVEPDNAPAALNLARALVELDRITEAAPWVHRLVQQSQDQEILEGCAKLLVSIGEPKTALTVGLRIYRDQPERCLSGLQLATQLRGHGFLDSANTLLDALSASVGDAKQQFRIAMARNLWLPVVYTDASQVDVARQRYTEKLNEFIQTYPAQHLLKIGADPSQFVWENFYLAYQGRDDRWLQESYGRWLCSALAAVMPEYAEAPPAPRRARPRLVMVSSFFRESTVGVYFFSWVQHLAQSGWELVLVQVGPTDDQQTRAFAHLASKLLRIESSLPRLAQRVRELNADILLYPEIGMEACVLALAALKLAPIQVCAWGHPVTTGMPSIDVFLSCSEMEPAHGATHYSERLVTLPGLGTHYLSPAIPSPFTRAQLGLPEDRHLYLVPQSPFKLHPDNDAVLMELVRRDPTALIVLFDGVNSGMTRLLRERLEGALSQVSSIPQRHLRFFPQCGRSHYLRINQACDVMLDSLYWSGGNTTLDALHCSLPVITCPGELMRGRQSMAMLKRLGCEDLIVANASQLAETAVALAHDRSRRNRVSQLIQDRLPELTASDAPLIALDNSLRNLLVN